MLAAGSLAYVAIGANLGDPVVTVRTAIAALSHIEHTQLVAASSLYRTAPVGLRNQPDFINAVAALQVDTAAQPAPTFLQRLLTIETTFGRIRSPGTVKNAPRTLDLDLLLYGNVRCHTTALTLPHPRLTERAFVLVPLAEIAPDLELPEYGPLAPLLAAVAHQRIERLP
jgi:2-amino-4-hydroxy-6-hydroxymethyldihydropteridine diphosphokinase